MLDWHTFQICYPLEIKLLLLFKIKMRKRKFDKFCNENIRKLFFGDTDFDILKMESLGSEELARFHTNLLKSQNFNEEMLFKPDNLHK